MNQLNSMSLVLNSMGNTQEVAGRMRVRSFSLIESGSYGKQYFRPFEFTIDGETFNTLNNRIDHAVNGPAGEITSNVFTGLGNMLIKPTTQPQGNVDVPYGWDTKRYQFILTVDRETTFGVETSIVMGYTDFSGIAGLGITNLNNSQKAHVDPNMRFIINSISRVRNTSPNTPMGTAPIGRSVINISHVHANADYISALAQNQFLISPANVLINSGMGITDETGAATNNAAEIGQSAVFSRVQDTSPVAFMHKLLGGYFNEASAGSHGNTVQEIMGSAAEKLSIDDPMSDPFIYAINKYSEYSGYGTTNSFNLAALLKIDPNAEAIMNIHQLRTDARSALPSNGYSEDWGITSKNSQVAVMINSIVSSLMMEFGLQTLFFNATNMTMSGQPEIVITNAQGFSNIQVGHLLPRVRDRILGELIMNVTFNGAMKFTIGAEVRLWGESGISVGFEGEAPTPYVVPSFADALYAPNTAPQARFLNSIASNFVTMKEQLIDKRPQTQPYSAMLGALEQEAMQPPVWGAAPAGNANLNFLQNDSYTL